MSRGRPPRKYPRTARVNEVVREVLAEEIERLSDPRLGFVTLTDVEVSRDLRHATVYYSALGKRGRAPDRRRGRGHGRRARLVDPPPPHRSESGGPAQVPSGAALQGRSGGRPGSAGRADPAGPARRRAADPGSTTRAETRAHRDGRGRRRRGRRWSGRRSSSRPRRSSPSRATSAPTATRSARCSALHHSLRRAGRTSIASFPSPFVVAPHYRELPGLDTLAPPDRIPADARRDGHVRLRLASPRLGDLEPAAKAAAGADRARPPRVERPLRDGQRHRSRRGGDRRGRPPAHASARARARARRRGLPLRRAGVRHRPVPVRDHHPAGVRPRARARGLRRSRRAAEPGPVRGAPVRLPAARRRGRSAGPSCAPTSGSSGRRSRSTTSSTTA